MICSTCRAVGVDLLGRLHRSRVALWKKKKRREEEEMVKTKVVKTVGPLG